MARSSVVYVVIKYGIPIAAFTVKHELISWYERTARKPEDVVVWRIPDNHPERLAAVIEYPFDRKTSSS